MRRFFRHPVRLVPIGFLVAILLGTGLLMLPPMAVEPRHPSFITALFTSTSAISVSGLAVVSTPDYWSTAGLVVIAVLTQLGGLGILTGAALVILTVSRRLGLHNRLLVQAETLEYGLGNIRRLLLHIGVTVLVCETLMTIIVSGRLWLDYDYSLGRALWSAGFHSVQTFNNSGFSLYPDGLRGFSRDPWVTLPLALGGIVGGLGFPALFEAARQWRRPVRWAVATKLSIWGSLALVVVGTMAFLAIEWANRWTIGQYGVADKLLAAFGQIALARTGGIELVPATALREESYPLLIGLMFIGGGSASTAGGIKVSTFFLLAFVIWAEIRGEPDVTVGHRRVATASQRQALTVTLLSVAIVAGATTLLIAMTNHLPFQAALFEITSAFSTTGLTVGVTSALSDAGHLLLIALMYIGRVGPLTLGSAIALNTRHRLYRYAEEQPIVG
ncbi:potassium transporter Trk [Micromonospora qiuiae]|uniref:Potassium transporter Trk n=1 Tax=Micromonospora qiuiae TaxID=502268 RepID=A0ABQ4J814_9ACTN|nr:potassium transporter TrkG [Micromonospora qiuiae]GIJ26317.1 potassium transporter Trk [Micromonospora qiuiae]